MSKAFTKEDEGPEQPTPLPPRPAEPQPITPQGLGALQREHADLLAQGFAQGHRARVLAQVLATVVARAPALHDGGAGFGCFVDVKSGDGRVARYQLVGPDEAAPQEGRVSASSPLGRALWGARAGSLVTWSKPRRDEELEVLSVALPD